MANTSAEAGEIPQMSRLVIGLLRVPTPWSTGSRLTLMCGVRSLGGTVITRRPWTDQCLRAWPGVLHLLAEDDVCS